MSTDSLVLVPAESLEYPAQSDLVLRLEHLGNHKKKMEESLPEESLVEVFSDQQK